MRRQLSDGSASSPFAPFCTQASAEPTRSVLVLWSEYDQVCPLEGQRKMRLVRGWENAKYEVLDTQHHNDPLLEPFVGETGKDVSSFLLAHERPQNRPFRGAMSGYSPMRTNRRSRSPFNDVSKAAPAKIGALELKPFRSSTGSGGNPFHKTPRPPPRPEPSATPSPTQYYPKRG